MIEGGTTTHIAVFSLGTLPLCKTPTTERAATGDRVRSAGHILRVVSFVAKTRTTKCHYCSLVQLASSTPVFAHTTSTVPSPRSASNLARRSWCSLMPFPRRNTGAFAVPELCTPVAPAAAGPLVGAAPGELPVPVLLLLPATADGVEPDLEC